MDLELFIPITKIDEAKRLVFGTIAEEVPDKSDEIMDYDTAKPEFEAWSAEIAKASNGRSVGNLRAMHGSVAAGKLDQILFDDGAKRIATVAKVVDDAEWKKVLEGVYTGFSMGGHYVSRWPDPERPGLTRYTPRPMEVSLVDHPCIPSATFEVVKTDGSREARKFKPSAAERDASREAAEFADPGYQADGKMRYPLDTEAHIRAAWAYIHHDRNQKPYTDEELARIKAKIVAAWKRKIDAKGPPLAAGKTQLRLPLAKDMADVSELARIVDELAEIAQSLDDPGGIDGSLEPLKATLESLVALLQSLLDEAAEALVPGGDGSDDGDEDSDSPDEDDADNNEMGEDDVDDDDMGEGDGADQDDNDNDDDDDLAAKRAGSDLRKALARFDGVAAQLVDLTKRLEHLESQPMPGGPVKTFVTVTKEQDMAGREMQAFADPLAAFQRHLDGLTGPERAHVLTKLALRNPASR